MAAAAGKKSTTSMSLFMEAYGLEVEEELSTLATEYWAEGVWTGRGLAGAVMCETRDLGIKWPYWSDESECQACHKDKGTAKHTLHRCPEWHELRRRIPDAFRKWEQKTRISKKVEVVKRHRRAFSQ